jgi:D-3-phosphoglycerate dehydrogenase / 2-oxoglutarate reductase
MRNTGKPAFIGALLDAARMNIATFNLGRDRAGGDAICHVAVDTPVDAALIAKIEAIPQVKRARKLAF